MGLYIYLYMYYTRPFLVRTGHDTAKGGTKQDMPREYAEIICASWSRDPCARKLRPQTGLYM